MRKLTLVLSTAALAMTGAAFAQTDAQADTMTMGTPRPARPDITRADAQARAERIFARMDANGDGTVNEADHAAMKAKMFDRLDADKNGSISQVELTARHGGDRKRRMAKRERGPADAPPMTDAQKAERHAAMFARIDTDKNGAISRTEFEAMHAARGAKASGGDHGKMGHRMGGHDRKMGPSGHHGMKMMDGPVTRQAFVDGALARFDKSDANRDGTVTQAERKAMRETMRQQWRAKKTADDQS